MNQAPLPWKTDHLGSYSFVNDARGKSIFMISREDRTRDAQKEIADRIVEAVNNSAPASDGGAR